MTAFRIHAFAAATLAAAVTLVGCSHKVNVQTDQGSVSVDSSANGTTTIKSGQGQMSVGKGAVDAASIGLPVYPGATAADNGSVSVSDTSKGQGSQVVVMTTTDPFDKVYEYYKGQMPSGSEKMKVSSGDSDIAQFQVGDSDAKDQKVVMITGAKGKVTIELTHVTKP